MSAVVVPGRVADPAGELLLLGHADSERVFAWRDGRPVCVREFLADVADAAALLPETGSAINLCDDRYLFLVGFCAAASRGHISLLPSSRALQVIADVRANYAGTYLLGESHGGDAHGEMFCLPRFDSATGLSRCPNPHPSVIETTAAAIGFTSGSTGQPKANIKTWQNFRLGSALNIDALCSVLTLQAGETAQVLATVPPQHMYGMELSVLLPLFGPFSVHSGRPLFPADIAAELETLPMPRVLVTTPVHLQALLRAPLNLPSIAAIVSATAPLTSELAKAAEARFATKVIELFGSTETCVIAHRRTAAEAKWHLYPDVNLSPLPDGTVVNAGHLSDPVGLQDIVELHADRQFTLSGRNADLLEIAGKRASLADLTRRLNALEGVHDGVVFQLDASETSNVRRIAALVVAPGRSDKELRAMLRKEIDPVFLPRPLRIVDRLPRNETGKLPRQALISALQQD
ncbi:MAG TPA: AMP-binding protein [Dokdonella sp.]|uniref:AMP-binding protein n=1 Tax=Dokdonella sp. TaxID=2291710 RepID=UPI002D7ED730|nr:AMP-binding protein [Dokdonella sp.]HET9031514.1 AMP-binding protein [Dokdonella sp.]